jgi:hypothetical protein
MVSQTDTALVVPGRWSVDSAADTPAIVLAAFLLNGGFERSAICGIAGTCLLGDWRLLDFSPSRFGRKKRTILRSDTGHTCRWQARCSGSIVVGRSCLFRVSRRIGVLVELARNVSERTNFGLGHHLGHDVCSSSLIE